MKGYLLPVVTLWWREITRFRRQRSRVVSAIVQPFVFWILLGAGLSASFRPSGVPDGISYTEYFYPGIVVLVILFTAIFATISIVNDRREGFLQGVLVAPVPRWCVVLGQALGGTTLALLEGLLFLFIAPFIGIPMGLLPVLASIGVIFLLSFGMTNLGLIIAWRMDSTQGFHAIMNLILIPIWLLSGAFFPASGVPVWLEWAMRLNPLTYGLAAFRRCLYFGHIGAAGAIPPLKLSLWVTTLLCVLAYVGAIYTAYRR
jgi:ABC-2 type transport system permease protein